ncbi:MAG TPA: hypothetical protein VL309_02900 [Vicinamibacterales bacterium]|nr:hypothetical protein [Vicinamibacterales bacterium]
MTACLLRAAALPLPGTGDVTVWKIWAFEASRHGVAGMYGVGGTPPERRIVEFAGTQTVVDYPPLALYELGAAGDLYWRWSGGRFPNRDALNVFVKLPGLACEALIAVLLFLAVRRAGGVTAARWTAAGYLLNPAAIIDASVLGYLDPQFLAPALGALVASAAGWSAAAGALAACAVLTKAQALFVLPAVAIGVWNAGPAGRAKRIGVFGAAAVATAAVIVAPVVRAGGWPNMAQAVGRLAHHDMLSANACNLWWVAGWALRVWYSIQDMGLWAALTAPARILTITRVMEIGYPNPRMLGAAMTIAAIGWAAWTARRSREPWTLAALAGFSVHAYATLAAQVHENHLFAAVPFLVLAAAVSAPYRPVAAVVSAIAALNLNLFYGFGAGVGYALPRAWTIVDVTLVVSVVECAALAWHARVFSRECSTAGGRRQLPAPASIPAQAARSRS